MHQKEFIENQHKTLEKHWKNRPINCCIMLVSEDVKKQAATFNGWPLCIEGETLNPIKQQKLCEGCTWQQRNADANACAFNRCVYEPTGRIVCINNAKYEEYKDRLTGSRVLIWARWYKVNI